MLAKSCPPSRLSIIPMSREATVHFSSIKEERGFSNGRDEIDIRQIKTAPAGRTSSTYRKNGPFRFRARQPSQPEIRPFSEKQEQQHEPAGSVPVSPTSPAHHHHPHHLEDWEFFKDRSYMSDVYSWARAHQEKNSESIKGMDLTATILTYKPVKPKRSMFERSRCSDSEDPLRSGMGYQGYMDCLLRGRRDRINSRMRKPRGITSELNIKDEEPTLVPMNSFVKDNQ